MSGAGPAAGGGRALAAILVSSCALKLALLVPAHATFPVGDARDYLVAAHQILEGDYRSIRPPLWPATLAASIRLASLRGAAAVTPLADVWPGTRRDPRPPVSDLDVARLAMVAMSTLSVWLVFLLGRELFDRRAGLAAAALFAFYPPFVGYTHLLWAETQFALLNVAWVLLLWRGVRTGRTGFFAAGGVGLGLAALTRQLIASFAAVVAVWVLFVRPGPWRPSARRAAAFALGAALVVAPWSARNALEYGELVPIAPMGGWALLHGIDKDISASTRRAGIPAAVERVPPARPIDTDHMARAYALAVIRSDPGAYARHALSVNLPDLWRPGSRVLEYARRGGGEGPRRGHGYRDVPPRLGLALVALFAVAYPLVLGAGLVGAALAPRWRETLLFAAMGIQAVAMHTLIGANLRHRLYLMPFAIAYAGFAVSRRRGEWRALATPRRLGVAAALAGLFALVLAAGDPAELREQWRHFRAAARRGASPVAGEPPSHVLLVSIDSLRADHLGAYGYARDTSPRIDALAREGVLFEHAVSSTSWTLPAHAALFTGLVDDLHGVHDESGSLAPGVPTLAVQLRDAGFATGAVVSGPFLHPRYGLSRGFDDYRNCMSYLDEDFRPLVRGNLHAQSHRDEPGPCVVRAAERWLAAHREGPAFLFLHFWDVHYDYDPPAELAARFDPDYAGDLDASDLAHNPAIAPDMDPRDLAHVVALYDGEIAYTDALVGRVLDRLDALGLRERTLVALTSDHGDAFFEHGEKGHQKDLHAEVLRIPLVLRGPGVPAGVRHPGPAHLTDVAPTVLALAGVAPDPRLSGAGAGRSLVPAFHDEGAFADRLVSATLRTRDANFTSLEGRAEKLVRDHDGRDVLYDLAADPGERRPRPAGERAAALDAHLVAVARRADEFPRPRRAPQLDAFARERLRALGYAE